MTCHCGCSFNGDIGLRHIAILKLVGTEAPDMGGVLELYPINGKNFFYKLMNGAVGQAGLSQPHSLNSISMYPHNISF